MWSRDDTSGHQHYRIVRSQWPRDQGFHREELAAIQSLGNSVIVAVPSGWLWPRSRSRANIDAVDDSECGRKADYRDRTVTSNSAAREFVSTGNLW